MSEHFLVGSKEPGVVALYEVSDGGGADAPSVELLDAMDVGHDLGSIAWNEASSLAYASVRKNPAVVRIQVDCSAGRLRALDTISVPDPIVSLEITGDLQMLCGASYDGNSVMTVALNSEGGFAGTAERTEVGLHPHCAVFDRRSNRVWLTVLGYDTVVGAPVIAGDIDWNDAVTVRLPAGFGPRHLTIDAQSGRLFVLGEQSDLLAEIDPGGAFVVKLWSAGGAERGMAHGVIRERQIADPAKALDGRLLIWSADLVATPGGAIVMSTERSGSTISVSESATGSLLQVVDVATQPRAIGLVGDGRYLVVTGERWDNLQLFTMTGEGINPDHVATAPVASGALWVATGT